MVDRDRIRKRSKGSSKSKKKDSSSVSSGRSGSKDKSGGGGIDLDDRTKQDTYGDKMEKMKGNTGGTSASTMIKRSHAAKVLESMANILLYVEGKMRSTEDCQNKREEIEHGIYSTIYDEFTKFVGQYDVQAICERYNIDWQEDVVEAVLQDQNFDNNLDKMSNPSNTVVNVGRGAKFEKKHFHQLLLAMGYMFMFVKTLEKKYENPSDNREKIGNSVITDVSAKCIDFIGSFGVEKISKENGISFERDILSKVGG